MSHGTFSGEPEAVWLTEEGTPDRNVHDVACVQAGSDKKKRRAADRMFFHGCRDGGCSISQSTIFCLGVPIGAAAKDVPFWQAALATEAAGPRTRRSDDELKRERDFQLIADRVLTAGETDDPLELGRRADEAMLAVAGFKSTKTGKAR